MKAPRTFKIIELGCPKSEVDSSHLACVLEDHGLERVWDEDEPADISIVNTCAFLRETKDASLKTLRSLKAQRNSIVVAFGCLVEGYPKEAMDSADAAIGLFDIEAAYETVESLIDGRPRQRPRKRAANLKRLLPRSLAPRNYHYLKVAEGCSNFCRYCRIPHFRGRFQSRPIEHLTEEAEALIDAGTQEIILVAQDLTRWGEDIYGRPRLELLLERLAPIADGRWIRLLYLHPARATRGLIEIVAHERSVCSYLDIPIQHVSDGVLSRMGRPHGVKNPRFVIEWIRKTYPDIALRTTVMVGYPSETERDFKDLYSFCRSIEFDLLGAFAFSPEPRTPARRMGGRVPKDVQSDRLARIEQLSHELAERRNRRLIGKRLQVLRNPEPAIDGELPFRTEYQAPEIDGITWVRSAQGTPLQEKTAVKILGATGADCFAEEFISPHPRTP